MIHHALTEEQLAAFKRISLCEFEQPYGLEEASPEQKAERLDATIRARADERAERDDRNRHERRKAAAQARRT